MLKVQTFDREFGWEFRTRAWELPHAWSILAAYRRNYPANQHRLVDVSETGAITVLPDDVAAIALADEVAEDDAD